MSNQLKIAYFAHSWVSDWNHGNAHFLRGLARSLVRMGHQVRCFEELGGWSLRNLVRMESEAAIGSIDDFRRRFAELNIQFYRNDDQFVEFATGELRGTDVVILHEWNEPTIVNTVLSLREKLGFCALFHDTHHRAYTRAGEILRFHLHRFDGVLAFGEAVRAIYADGFGLKRVWTFHEGADIDNFKPLPAEKEVDVLWIGNWGDEERSRELQEFLLAPAAALGDCRYAAWGVRYPETALQKLQAAGIEYHGYLPNLRVPQAYARSFLALHVPRRQYANGLSGIPTIRVFEALACGTPLLCSPWTDTEQLFRPGADYLVVPDGYAMAAEIRRLLRDDAARQQLAENGLQTIRQRHTCAHRAQQLVEICEALGR
jgi:spore maturation protein CgeB